VVKIGFLISTKENENRRALLPAHLRQLANPELMVIEQGYGLAMGLKDSEYRKAGATVADRERVSACPIICDLKPMVEDQYYHPGKTLFGWIHAVQGRRITDQLLEHKMTAIAWEDMFVERRHVFWRNNEISGEAAVVHAFLQWGRAPYGVRAALIGQGNVGRGAVRALERLGCTVTVYNRMTSCLLRQEIGEYDVVVNAVLWDVFRDDHLVYDTDLDRMKPRSLIIDISCDEKMGVESSHPTTIAAPVYWHKNVLHYAVDHTAALYFTTASESISEALVPYLDKLVRGESCPVLDEATIIREGVILDQRIVTFQKR